MFPYFQTEHGYGVNADCFDAFPHIADQSIDLVLCDLPYGTTQNKWDSVLPLDRLWVEYNRVCRGPVVLTAAQPFTSVLVMSNLTAFKYDWCWHKEKGTGHLNAKKMPMRDKEDIAVFYKEQPTYNPQYETGEPYNGNARVGKKQQTDNYGKYEPIREDNDGKRYPKQVLHFNGVGRGGIHPTQKPVALMEYLIKTYTNEGDKVLDNTAGSMTTGVAAENLKRHWLCIERDAEYYAKAKERFTIIGEQS